MKEQPKVRTRDYAGVLARIMKPTQKHRPAIWEAMLGTVYAMNDAGEVKYFDYKWDEAAIFAGLGGLTVVDERDPRVWTATHSTTNIRKGQKVLYCLRAQPVATGRKFIHDDWNVKLVAEKPNHDAWHEWTEYRAADGSLYYVSDHEDYTLDADEFGPIPEELA